MLRLNRTLYISIKTYSNWDTVDKVSRLKQIFTFILTSKIQRNIFSAPQIEGLADETMAERWNLFSDWVNKNRVIFFSLVKQNSFIVIKVHFTGESHISLISAVFGKCILFKILYLPQDFHWNEENSWVHAACYQTKPFYTRSDLKWFCQWHTRHYKKHLKGGLICCSYLTFLRIEVCIAPIVSSDRQKTITKRQCPVSG